MDTVLVPSLDDVRLARSTTPCTTLSPHRGKSGDQWQNADHVYSSAKILRRERDGIDHRQIAVAT